jgi:formylglycine-generating enzyme required for sulfatase activity
LDKFEVTVGRFRQFVAAYDSWHGGSNPHPASGEGARTFFNATGWQDTWTLPADAAELANNVQCSPATQTWTAGDDDRPINCLNWYEAFAFCVWDGGRLPVELESTYASVAWPEQRPFPWGSTPGLDHDHAVYDCLGDGLNGCTIDDILVVGAKPQGAGKWGHLDLAGSVWEWVFDADVFNGMQGTFPPAPSCLDCVTIGSQTRIARGGGWIDPASSIAIARVPFSPDTRSDDVGVRCAHNL